MSLLKGSKAAAVSTFARASRAACAAACSAACQRSAVLAAPSRVPRAWTAPWPAQPAQELRQPPLASVRAMATSSKSLSFEVVDIHNPKELNFILGHSHFIKTVEDLWEALVQSGTALKFGIAFNEASGDRKLRFDGNDEALIDLAKTNAMALGAGHTFIIFLDGGFPVNVLNAVKAVPEVCRIHCATANPTSVIIARTSEEARGIMGVIDGVSPLGFETDEDKKQRHDFLRVIGYKR